jgi:hypothetical protein
LFDIWNSVRQFGQPLEGTREGVKRVEKRWLEPGGADAARRSVGVTELQTPAFEYVTSVVPAGQ